MRDWTPARWCLPLLTPLVLLALPALVGCEEPRVANGKQGVLFFAPQPSVPVAEGLTGVLGLPQRVRAGPGATQQVTYDFTGATLQVTPGAGLRVLDQRLTTEGDAGWFVRYACEPGGERRREMRVRVLSGGEERYADAFDLECVRPDSLALTVAPRDQLVVLEASVAVKVTLQAGNERLGGAGLALGGAPAPALFELEPQETPLDQLRDELRLKAVAAGQKAVLAAGPVSAVIPVQVLADSEWKVAVTATREADGQVRFLAEATTGTARAALAACQVTVTDAQGSRTVPGTGCTGLVAASPPGTVCATSRGNTGCADLAP